MLDSNFINNFAQKLSERLPPALKNVSEEFDKTLHLALQEIFSELDLVTRQEFDAQVAVLLKTREKLEELEKQMKERMAAFDDEAENTSQ